MYKNSPHKMEAQTRRKVVVRSRLWHGLKRLFLEPWTLVFPLLLVVAAALAWHNTDKLPLFGGNDAIPEMVVLWQLVLSALVIVLSALLFFGLLSLLGTPRRAKEIDAALLHIGLVDRYDLGPALLSSRRVKGSSVCVLEFWSKGISLTAWEDKGRAIEDVLDVHMVEAPTYGGRKGNNRRRIRLTVAPGAGNQSTAALYEDGDL